MLGYSGTSSAGSSQTRCGKGCDVGMRKEEITAIRKQALERFLRK
jgi:hypothetical protein